MNIFEKRKAQEQVEKDMREARSESAMSKREGRDLKKAQSTGRVSSFLNRRSQSDEVLRATLGVIRASDPLSQAQATIQYQQKIGEVTNGIRQVSSGGIGGSSEAGNELPPRPDDSEVYFLASENTELKWEAGGGVGCAGLALYTKDDEVWIGAGTVAGDLPSGFDSAEGKGIASSGSGDVWAEVNINDTTGDVTSVAVTGGGTTPNNTDTSFYYALGYYEYVNGIPTVTNYGCGSLNVNICRNWFVATAPFFSVSFVR
jgi:hypothetical protein